MALLTRWRGASRPRRGPGSRVQSPPVAAMASFRAATSPGRWMWRARSTASAKDRRSGSLAARARRRPVSGVRGSSVQGASPRPSRSRRSRSSRSVTRREVAGSSGRRDQVSRAQAMWRWSQAATSRPQAIQGTRSGGRPVRARTWAATACQPSSESVRPRGSDRVRCRRPMPRGRSKGRRADRSCAGVHAGIVPARA